MSALAHKLSTDEDLFDLPENLIGEIIHGQWITHRRPAFQQGTACFAIGYAFDAISFPLRDTGC